MPKQSKEQEEKLLQLVQSALEKDAALREQYKIGDKFRFVKDRLQALLTHVQENLTVETVEVKQENPVGEDEQLVYVYLYNAQGLVLQTWQKMLNPDVFYEYSVNRPIYTNKAHVESFIKQKSNKMHHGYLTVVVKKNDIIKTTEENTQKDVNNNPLVKVKEGSLHIKKLLSFTYNGHDYQVSASGEIIKNNNH
jgi:hypothetical protein